jgi:DNA-binding NtrC family response regulator
MGHKIHFSVKRIKKFNNDVNVVLMSAFETNDIESDLRELSLSTFLKKPMHIDQLILAIKRCINPKSGRTSAVY